MAHFAAMLSGNKFLLGSTAVTFTVGIVGLIINELASGDFDDENEDSFLCGWNYVTWYNEGNEDDTYYWSYAGGSSFIACAIFAVLLTLISVTGHIPNIPEPVLSKIPFNVYNKKNELFAYCILISGILWLLGIIIFIIDGSCYEEGWNNENENEDEYEDGYTWELTLWLSLLVGITQVSTGGAKLWDNMKQNKSSSSQGGNNNESLINNDGNADNNYNNNNVNNENDNSGVTPQTGGGGGGGGGGDAVMAPTTQASAPQQDDGGYARMG